MSSFEPIAIVGQGCVLPGAHNPEQFWDLLSTGQDLLRSADPEADWGTAADQILCDPSAPARDRTWSARGGYVQGFDQVFDPTGFALDPDLIAQLDPLFQWTLHAARHAWRGVKSPPGPRAGVVLGNLSYPTRALNDFALGVWEGSGGQTPHNRYMSGLPAHLISQALGLGEAFCLDAACASSLYAMKLSCDKLHDGSMDVMLAGGVNHADDLFLHVGFCALNALSKSGQSRPFHRGADGLVPAEGAGFVVLKRLDDAVADGDQILGVIRGIGLSNDGRGRGMLTPSEEGQWRAMQAAYQMSGLQPQDVSLIECHATGTPLGDATEIRSMARVFEHVATSERVAIGSSKSNFGHLITASGVAGLMKVLAAIKHKVRPPTLHAKDDPIPWLDETPFRLVTDAEAWESQGPRRGAINNFGFGGNNAHLLVEEWMGQDFSPAKPPGTPEPIVLTHMALQAGSCQSVAEFRQALFQGKAPASTTIEAIELDLRALKFPPNDMHHTLPQQLLALKVALDLGAAIDALPGQTTGLYMGMQCDTEIARYGARWRHEDPQTKGKYIGELVAAGVLGTMPNIVANRLNSQFDLLGPSFTVSSEQNSGLVALGLAARALEHGELDAAMVGAVDLCVDVAHQAAALALLPQGQHVPGDACVMMILKRESDAIRDGDPIIARLLRGPADRSAHRFGLGAPGATDLSGWVGHAHAASGLLHAAAAAILLQGRASVRAAGEHALPTLMPGHTAHVGVHALGQQYQEMQWHSEFPTPGPTTLGTEHLEVAVFWGATFDHLCQAVASRTVVRDHALREGASAQGMRLGVALQAGQMHAVLEDLVQNWPASVWPSGQEVRPGCWFGQGQGPQLVALITPQGVPEPESVRAVLLAHPEVGLGAPEPERVIRWFAQPERTHAVEDVAAVRQFAMGAHLNLLKTVFGMVPDRVSTTPVEGCLNVLIGPGQSGVGEHVVMGAHGSWGELDATSRVLGLCLALGVARAWEGWTCANVAPMVPGPRTMLTFAGHLPTLAPLLPYAPSSSSTRASLPPGLPLMSHSDSPQTMPAAPTLPPMLEDRSWCGGDSHLPPAPAAKAVTTTQDERPATPQALDVMEASAVGQGVTLHQAWGRHLASMSQMHREFLQRQAGMQQDFLEGRGQMGQTFGSLAGHLATGQGAVPRTLIQATATSWQPALAPSVAPPVLHASAPQAAETAAMQARATEAGRMPLGVRIPERPVAPDPAPKTTEEAGERLVGVVIGQQQKITPSHLKPPVIGPTFGYDALAIHASGKISDIFGQEFARQDDHRIQVRMPEPPLLLCDRVTGINCPKGVVSTGTLWCESDIPHDAWYLHEGRMPVGITIESGQADLMLISWMGADFANQGERSYRLLGCDLMFHEGGLARPGDTLCYDIHIDGHANQGPIRLFFFHYDLEIDQKVRLSVRNGQAGFFTAQELSESKGILWRPEDEDLEAMRHTPLAPGPCVTEKRRFGSEEVQAFAEGRVYEVFGTGFERAAAHTRTPTIQADTMRFMDEVVEFDPQGGPGAEGI